MAPNFLEKLRSKSFKNRNKSKKKENSNQHKTLQNGVTSEVSSAKEIPENSHVTNSAISSQNTRNCQNFSKNSKNVTNSSDVNQNSTVKRRQNAPRIVPEIKSSTEEKQKRQNFRHSMFVGSNFSKNPSGETVKNTNSMRQKEILCQNSAKPNHHVVNRPPYCFANAVEPKKCPDSSTNQNEFSNGFTNHSTSWDTDNFILKPLETEFLGSPRVSKPNALPKQRNPPFFATTTSEKSSFLDNQNETKSSNLIFKPFEANFLNPSPRGAKPNQEQKRRPFSMMETAKTSDHQGESSTRWDQLSVGFTKLAEDLAQLKARNVNKPKSQEEEVAKPKEKEFVTREGLKRLADALAQGYRPRTTTS